MVKVRLAPAYCMRMQPAAAGNAREICDGETRVIVEVVRLDKPFQQVPTHR